MSGLRAARLAAGLSQGRLAERANIEIERRTKRPGALDSNTISRMERGVIRWPAQRHLDALCAVLGATPAELGFEPRAAVLAPVDWAMERETASPEALDAIAAILASTRKLEDHTSSPAVLPTVRNMVAVSDQYASKTRMEFRPHALMLASELHTYRGWLHTDVGHDDSARADFDAAVSLAVEVDSADHLSHALSFKGDLAIRWGRLDQAVSLSQVSQRDKRTFLALRVYDGYQEAWAHALAGNTADAERAMLSVDGLLDKVPESTAPPGAYWYNVPFLLTQRATVHEALGRPDQAVRDLETGLAEMPAAHRSADWSRTIRARLATLRGSG